MKDYVTIADTALRLVKEAGRLVTFRKFLNTLDDVSKPWATSPALRTGATEVQLWAVSVHPTDINVLGIRIRDDDLLKHIREVLIIAPGIYQGDLKLFQEVDDGTRRFRISVMEQLKPAGTTVLWFAGITD